MNNDLLVGVDCGATKVLIQSAIFDPESNNISPGKIYQEFLYSNHPNWDKNFLPVSLDIQRNEYKIGKISINNSEIIQGNIIIETIQQALSQCQGYQTGLCFPGIKNKNDIVILANGPRIINMVNRLDAVNTIYNDSDCCVMGEWKSTIGKMKNINNGIYIGGGTGIADGLVLNGEMIDFNHNSSPKRSWELTLPSGDSVESWLSPSGIIKKYNLTYNTKYRTLSELSRSNQFFDIVENVLEAFSFLVDNRIKFFQKNNESIEKIVIGQRLGHFLLNGNNRLGKMFMDCTDLNIDFSSDRRTAALGAAWKILC